MTSAQIRNITRAVHFAATKHKSQQRKGKAAEPYVNHLAEVAYLLASHTDDGDVNLIIAGYLHDTIEDTETTFEELVQNFGQDVASLVREVTDDKSLSRSMRKQMQIENAPHKSSRAKQIKIADKISNLNAILTSPPENWSATQKCEYFDWAKQVAVCCRGANQKLDDAFTKVWMEGRSLISENNAERL